MAGVKLPADNKKSFPQGWLFIIYKFVSKKENLIKSKGIITEALGNCQFRVKIVHEEKEYIIRCYLNGKMRQNRINTMVADKVDVEIPISNNLSNSIGRITYRYK